MKSDTESSKCIDEAAGSALLHYAMGSLAEAARQEFEEHLIACPACQNELREHEAALSALSNNRPELLKRLGELQAQNASQSSRKSVVWRTALFAAAACLAGFIFWTTKNATQDISPNKSQSPDVTTVIPADSATNPTKDSTARSETVARQIASLAVFAPIQYTPVNTRSEESPARQKFGAAMKYYLNMDYNSALTLLVESQRLDTTDTEIGLFTGLVLGMHGKLDASQAVLETALRQKPRVTRTNQLKWLVAQNLLARSEPKRALEILGEVASSGTAVAQKAREQIVVVQKLTS